MASRPQVSIAELRSRLTLDPLSGTLFWLPHSAEMFSDRETPSRSAERLANTWNSANAGKPALNTIGGNGYRHGTFDKKSCYAHLCVFALYYGQWPTDCIDHADGDRANNRPENLRSVSYSENNAWVKRANRPTSGYIGVYSNGRSRWTANVSFGGKMFRIGTFDCPVEAAKARDQKAIEIHGDFARLNFP